MKAIAALIVTASLPFCGAAVAQLLPALPRVGDTLRPPGGVLDPVTRGADRSARSLVQARLDRIARLVRANPDRIALDPAGAPARAAELVVGDPGDGLIAAAGAKGMRLIERGEILGVGYARFGLPQGMTLKSGIATLHRLGAQEVSADNLYAASGGADDGAPEAIPPNAGRGPRIGMIDGGVSGIGVKQRGFATGAPRASEHGIAIASLIAGSGRVRGAAPGAAILAADIYGSDPAGGNATAMIKALGWLAGERVPVVTISLVGPPNALLARVVAAAQARGTLIVAAVGNDGPAATPAYPASYPGVIAVTAIDARGRILIEAGRATHLDYAAPGADMVAATIGGGVARVRGTSFATPLVAATLARAYLSPDPSRRAAALAIVDAGAERRDRRYGRGIVCGGCATPTK